MNQVNFDNIFKKRTKNLKGNFQFNQEVAQVFDNMLIRSIPFYKKNQELIIKIITKKIKKNAFIYDLGCSTGYFFFQLIKQAEDYLKKRNIKLIGLDASLAMIKKAQKKKKFYLKNCKFLQADILNYPYQKTDLFILNYTFQFIPLPSRLAFLKNLYQSLKTSGLLIISEKIIEKDHFFTTLFNELHQDFKKINKYSTIEITRKRKSLEKILIPFTYEKHTQFFKKAGFSKISILFKANNFITIIAKK